MARVLIDVSYIRLGLQRGKKTYNSGMHKPIHAQIPLYRQVAETILQQLAEGLLKPGQYLPSEWDLARQWKISQGTVRKGLGELVAQGVLARQQGVGTYVTHKNTEWGDYPLLEGISLLQVQAQPVWPKAEILSVSTVPADDETAVRLNLRNQEPVWRLLVLWRNGHQAVALDEAFLPVTMLPEFNRHFVHRRLHVYAFLQLHYGISVRASAQFLAMHDLPAEVARLLKAKASAQAWCWYRQSVDTAGQVVEWRRRFVVPGSMILQMCLTDTAA